MRNNIATLNVVGKLYQWSLTRLARRSKVEPADLEKALAVNKRSRPRLVVMTVLSGFILEICGVVLVPGLVAVLVSRAIGDDRPTVSAVLDGVGSLLAVFPLSLVIAVGLWGLRRERRTGGYVPHPERLWPATILTAVVTVILALLLWPTLR